MKRLLGAVALVASAFCLALSGSALAFDHPITGPFHTVTSVGSTVPPNGDLNPYGIVTVPTTVGSLVRGDLLISNFNNAANLGNPNVGNLQGKGSTIVQLTPTGGLSVFAQINPATLPGPCPGGVGLTTALAILPHGYVVVGSLPTSDGKANTAEAGCLIVLNSAGDAVKTISGPPINGPWDMTAVTGGEETKSAHRADTTTLFVTNVLNGTVAANGMVVNQGTVVRIRLRLHRGEREAPAASVPQVIASGFPERSDPNALVVGPTGVALGEDGVLYVADTQGNRIAAIADALNRNSVFPGGGTTVATGGFLNNPLGLTLAPNGDLLAVNANDGNMVESTPVGAEFQPIDTGAGSGGLFGLTVAPDRHGVYFVNDTANTLDLLH